LKNTQFRLSLTLKASGSNETRRLHMARNYYITLGIGQGANLNQIKKAYRTIAKKSHPDTTQSGDSRVFREVKEAYEILSDSERRRQYDAKLEKEHPRVRQPSALKRSRIPVSPLDEIFRFESPLDDFFGGFVPGLFSGTGPGPRHKDLYYQVILSVKEAREGGLFPIKVPVIEKCPHCKFSPFETDFFCPECNGYGFLEGEKKFAISIPPRTSNHTEVTLSLEDIGLKDVNLYLTITIDPYL
jgi:molecular chaperone DnaJ